MTIDQFLTALNNKPESIQFTDTMELIDAYYHFTPCEFTNGELLNEANQNNGSCKLLAFALLYNLNTSQALECFGNYYRVDVLQHPQNNDHQNIRNLITHGLKGVHFKDQALLPKA